MVRTVRRSAPSPTCQFPVPADSTSTRPSSPASATYERSTTSAVGERQMLPEQTKQTRKGPAAKVTPTILAQRFRLGRANRLSRLGVLPCVGRISTLSRRAVPDLDADAGRGAAPWPPADPRTWDADQAVTVLYSGHYRSLVRTAGFLVRDVATAEEVVQEAYVGLYRRWDRLRDPEAAVGYLRQAVINGSRSVLRRRGTADRNAPVLYAAHVDAPDPAHDVAARRTVSRRSPDCRSGSARSSSCATTPTSPRPTSPRLSASAEVPSSPTHPGASRRCGRCCPSTGSRADDRQRRPVRRAPA